MLIATTEPSPSLRSSVFRGLPLMWKCQKTDSNLPRVKNEGEFVVPSIHGERSGLPFLRLVTRRSFVTSDGGAGLAEVQDSSFLYDGLPRPSVCSFQGGSVVPSKTPNTEKTEFWRIQLQKSRPIAADLGKRLNSPGTPPLPQMLPSATHRPFQSVRNSDTWAQFLLVDNRRSDR